MFQLFSSVLSLTAVMISLVTPDTKNVSHANGTHWRRHDKCFCLMKALLLMLPPLRIYMEHKVTEAATINDHSQPCSFHHQWNCSDAKPAACLSNATWPSPKPMTLQIRPLLGIHSLSPTVWCPESPVLSKLLQLFFFQTYPSSIQISTYVDISELYDEYSLGST